jgi:DNA-binding CsgD family transcriptional regulator
MRRPGDDVAFIGRADELANLDRALTDTKSGRAAIVVVSGESGVGKTRLVTEFLHRAEHQGATVLVGGCTDFGENGPSYWAFLEALRPVWADVGSPAVASSLPEVPTVAPPPGVDQSAPGPIPLFEMILRVLRWVAEMTPVVVLIEDVHWADRSTRDLLAFLLANLHLDRVMMIVTYRSEALGRRHSLQPLLAELRRGRRAEFMAVLPFTREEMVAQLHAIVGRTPEPELVELTWSRSDGNAFFAEELVAAIADGYGNELPPTLRPILMCRVEVLVDPAKRVLRLVAVANEGVTFDLLAAVSEGAESDLAEALRECVEHQLLAVESDGRTYRFRHSLMQEVLYDELLPGERQLFHEAYARALSRQMDRPDSVGAAKLAYHWYAAGNAERALAAAVMAAAAAAAIFGFGESLRLYERAIELWDQVADAPAWAGLDRSDLFERTAEVAHLAGEHRRASALILDALAESPPRGAPAPSRRADAMRRAVRHQRLGRYLWASGDSRESLKAYQEAVACLPAGEVSAERAGVEGAYAEALMLSGRYRSSRDQAEAALQVARQAGALLEETQILATLGFDLAFLGDSASGVSALERAQVIAEELGNPDDIGRAYLNRAEILSGPLNSLAEAAKVAELGVARVRQLGLERTYGVALQAIAVNTLFRLGRWREADHFLNLALAAKPTGSAAIDLCLARAKLSVGRGQFEAAEADLRAVETLAAGGLGPRFEAPLLTLRAGMDLWLGRPQQAREAVSQGIIASISGSDDVWLLAPLIWHGLRAEADIAEVARARQDTVALEQATTIAAGLWTQVQNLAEDSQDAAPAIQKAIEAYLLMCQGEAARAEGRPEPDVWADAAKRWLDLQQPYPSAYSNWREADALLAQRSRSSRAAEVLRRAHQTAVRLGAVPFRRELEALASRARLVLAVPESPPVEIEGQVGTLRANQQAAQASYRLSRRELEVWLKLPEGLTNNQIGDQLFISGKTVSVHVTNILRKLGVKSRVQAITLAHQLGLVAPRDPDE